MDIQQAKQEFIDIYKQNITREGADKLLEYLLSEKSDFFTAPASTRFHGSYAGGLLEHSLNVYRCLNDYLSRERAKNVYKMNYSNETIAVCSLLHDICKVNFYKTELRNSKDEATGQWIKVPFYKIDDQLPYGHGEKSVYIIPGFMKLERAEAFAIRYHMGFSNTDEKNQVGKAFEMFPLAFAVSTADMEATYFIESRL